MENAPETHPYHHYLFFQVSPAFYGLPEGEQAKIKGAFVKAVANAKDLIIEQYATLGFKANTTFMLWCRAKTPTDVQEWLPKLLHTGFGPYLTLSHTHFGMVRPSQYSGRTGKPEQVMQNYTERMPYLIVYPFTKTQEWYLLDATNRGSIMGQHIKIGIGHPDIRQCLLYSYGLDDNEFVVSYETATLEEFQDLVRELRSTLGRTYTLNDTPIFTCAYKPLQELANWL